MGLEAATYISQLVATNPVGATDPRSQGDDHLRLLKLTLQNTFPAMNAAVSATPAQLNQLNSGQLTSLGAGSVSAPPYSFSGDPDTGIYRAGANVIGIAAGAAQQARWDTVNFYNLLPMLNFDGAAGTPAYSFFNDTNTGMYRGAADQINFATNGITRLQLTNSYAESVGTVYFDTFLHAVSDGTAGNPAYSWFSDPDTGIYRNAANSISISAGGVQQFVVNTANIIAGLAQIGTDGSAANPAYSFVASTGTGLFRPAGFASVSIAGGGVVCADFASGRITLGSSAASNFDYFGVTSLVAAAGGTAIPTAAGFIHCNINGTLRKIPYCA